MGDTQEKPFTSRINGQVAEKLQEIADILDRQGANPFRVGAYRRAADTVTGLAENVDALLARGGLEALMALPGIGRGIATAIDELVRTGRWAQLERLRGTLDPVKLFQTVPGIGPQLARNIHDELHLDTLEALELAARDGRLATVRGVGSRRATAIRATLEVMLDRV
ncbi:MAG: helix-hairpin-helix domain-containing protein, partial [Pseudomonadota bacterium]